MNRNYVYAFPSAYNTCNVVNYRADSNYVNSSIHLFDIWGSFGDFKLSFDGNSQEVWFECNKEFFDMLHTETMKNVFKHMGVELVFEYPFDNMN